MLVCAAARLVRPDDVVVVGLGLPQMAALLARRIHAPRVRLLLEVGVFEPEVRGATMGIADPRMWEGSRAFGGMLDVLGLMLHGGRVSLGILGALQVDVDGSINSSMIQEGHGPPRRFLGSGGANDIASLAGRVVVVLQHQPRKFKATLDFLTSPGRRVRGRPRTEVGLPGQGTAFVVTDRAVIEVVDDGVALRSVHPGEDPERLLAETPIPLLAPPAGPTVTEPPSAPELELVRTELDPHGWYTR
jgi:glutaconate CoA-transferase subunit B